MIHKFSFIEKVLLKFNMIPHPIVDSLSTVIAGRALQVSVKMGILDAIGETPKSAAKLAEQTGVSERGTRVLLDCLDALGYVKKQAEGYRLTLRGKKFLSKDSPFGFQKMLLFSDYLYNTLTELESTVKSGKPDHIDYESFTPELWDIFTNAMREFSRTNASEIANLIPLPPNAKRLLDLGGSHGLYSTELCKRFPSLSAEIIDFSPV
jgi:predicted transcriptional regulator